MSWQEPCRSFVSRNNMMQVGCHNWVVKFNVWFSFMLAFVGWGLAMCRLAIGQVSWDFDVWLCPKRCQTTMLQNIDCHLCPSKFHQQWIQSNFCVVTTSLLSFWKQWKIKISWDLGNLWLWEPPCKMVHLLLFCLVEWLLSCWLQLGADLMLI